MIIGIVLLFANPVIAYDFLCMGEVLGRLPSGFFVTFPLNVIFDAPFAFLGAYSSVFKNTINFIFFFAIY